MDMSHDREPAPDVEHVPVLADELLELVDVRPGDVVVDGTFGAGGHARLLTARMEGRGSYIGIDRDPAAEARFQRFADEQSGVATRFVAGTFPDAFSALAADSVSADVVILDIGVSSMQIDEPQRGFSYMNDGPLDMRMDPTTGTGADVLVNEGSPDDIARVLREYGEEPSAWRIAQAIVTARDLSPLTTTRQLANVVYEASPAAARTGRGHPAKRTFQALRIAVNDELGMIDRGLDAALSLLKPGGRLAVIAFHSLEDRIVKRRFAAWRGQCTCPPGLPVCACGAHAKVVPLTRRAVKAGRAELERNPRAASSRLRAVSAVQVDPKTDAEPDGDAA